MGELLIIAKLKNLASKEAKKISFDTKAIGDAAQKASVGQAVMSARTTQLNKKLRDLGKEVNFGKKSITEANAEFSKFQRGLPVLNSGLEQSATTTRTFGDRVTSTIGTVKNITAAAAAAGAVFKKAFDLADEGSQILRTEERFIALNESIGSVADDTLVRLQNATDGAVSKFKLMEGSNLLLATGVAKSDDELVKLIENVIKLKKPTESASAAVENFSLLMANQSIPRLDSFGISASKVRDRVAELKTGVNALGKEAAFNQAVMEQMEVTIGRVGESGEFTADEFTKLRAEVENITDSGKTWLASGLTPLLSTSRELVETVKETGIAYTIYGKKIDIVKRSMGDLNLEQTAWQHSAGLTIDQIEELSTTLEQNVIGWEDAAFRAEFYKRNTADAATATDEIEISVEDFNAALEANAQALEDQEKAAKDDAAELKKLEINLAKLEERQVAVTAKTRGYFNEALKATAETSLYGVALEDLGTRQFIVSGLTAAQQESLGELTLEQDKALDSIRSLESGIEGIGLTEEERNDKIQEQRDLIVELDSAMQPLVNTTGTMVEKTVEATFSLDAINTRLFEQAQTANLSAEQVALLGVATGQMTEEQAAAAVEAAIMSLEIDNLVKSYAAGKITAEQAAEAAGLLAGGLNETAAGAINAVTEVDKVKISLDNIDGKVVRARIRIKVKSDPVPSGFSEAQALEGSGPGGEAEFAMGGFTGNSSGIAGQVHGREFVFNEAATKSLGVPLLESLHNMAQSNGGSGDTSISNDLSGMTIMQQPGENSEQLADRIIEKMGQDSREIFQSGSGLTGATLI